MWRIIKRILIGLGVLLLVGAIGLAIFAKTQSSAYDASMDRVYDIPLPDVSASKDPAVLERGKHLVDAVAACSSKDCHGSDLSGGATVDMGPVGKLTGPNITSAGLGAVYDHAELARLLRHGVKKDGRSIRFMPVQDINWLSDEDVTAIVSYLRTVPAVEKSNAPTTIGLLGKVLDRREVGLVLDVARHIDHEKADIAPTPSPTKEYGKYVIRLCTGCHGEHLSGGRIPGAPSSLPVPLNLTPDASGLAGWTYDDFDTLLTKGERKNGRKLDPFMPIESFGRMNETEKKAMFEYLMGLPPKPLGGR